MSLIPIPEIRVALKTYRTWISGFAVRDRYSDNSAMEHEISFVRSKINPLLRFLDQLERRKKWEGYELDLVLKDIKLIEHKVITLNKTFKNSRVENFHCYELLMRHKKKELSGVME